MANKRVFTLLGAGVILGIGVLGYLWARTAADPAAPRDTAAASTDGAAVSRGMASGSQTTPGAHAHTRSGATGAALAGEGPQMPTGIYRESDVPTPFPDTEVGRKLNHHAFLAFEMGPDAEANYQSSLAELRKSPKEATELLFDAYKDAKQEDYTFRSLMAATLAELHSPHAFGALNTIATQTIPPESGDLHHFSSVDKEIGIRVLATGGLARLAADGAKSADDTLLRIAVSTEHLTIRREAVRAFVAAGDFEERSAILRKSLPSSAHNLISQKVDSVVEQSRVLGLNEQPHREMNEHEAQILAPFLNGGN